MQHLNLGKDYDLTGSFGDLPRPAPQLTGWWRFRDFLFREELDFPGSESVGDMWRLEGPSTASALTYFAVEQGGGVAVGVHAASPRNLRYLKLNMPIVNRVNKIRGDIKDLPRSQPRFFCGCIAWGCLAASQETEIPELDAWQRHQGEHRGPPSAKASVCVIR